MTLSVCFARDMYGRIRSLRCDKCTLLIGRTLHLAFYEAVSSYYLMPSLGRARLMMDVLGV